jgi:preprotein translocase subunit SecG
MKKTLLLGSIFLVLTLIAVIAQASPQVTWIRPSGGNPEYLLADQEFELVVDKIDQEVQNLKPTHVKILIGAAVEEPLIIIRFSNATQKWIKETRNATLDISLSSPPQSIRVVGVIPSRFTSQKVGIVTIRLSHGNSLLSEFSVNMLVFTKNSAEYHELSKQLEIKNFLIWILGATVVLLLVVVILITLTLQRKRNEPLKILQGGGR